MSKIKYYVESLRLRTLPLSVAGIAMGSMLAAAAGFWSWGVFVCALLTAIFLQVLSNVANELGDLQKGTDNEYRLGPIRSVQSGYLTRQHLFGMLLLMAALSVVAGLCLVWLAFRTFYDARSMAMLVLGIAAVFAAVKYTYGKKTYGYVGLGDLFVFLFFGPASVVGVYFLISKLFVWSVLLPAASVGLLSTAMLNLNNMRDIANDTDFRKQTVAVRMGLNKAKKYHNALIVLAFVLMTAYCMLVGTNCFGYFYLLTLPGFAIHLRYVARHDGRQLDRHMRIISLLTVAFALLGGLGVLLATR